MAIMSPSNIRLYYALLFFFIALTLLTYFNRTPTGDDAWFAEQSYWLLEDGLIRSEFFRGLNGWEKELLVSHKLFLWLGAVLMHFFGTALPVVQFTGLLFFVVLIAELVCYVRLREGGYGSRLMIALLILIFANRVLVKMSFQNRPEMMLAALGFGSWLLLFTGPRHAVKTMTAGVLAGLAFLAHLNGIIFLIVGFLTLGYLKRYKALACFTVFGLLTAAVYLIDILDDPQGLATWYYQFTNDPAARHGLSLNSKLIQLLTFPRMFLHSPEQMALTILFFYVLWKQREFIRELPAGLRIYPLLLVLTFWLITKGNSAMYMLFFIPFMLILLYELYRRAPFFNRPLAAILAGYFIIGTFGMGQLIHKNIAFGGLPDDYAGLRKHLSADKTGLVPLTFFFNEYEEYDRLLTHENYKLHHDKATYSAHQMSQWAGNHGADFILYDYEFLTESYYPEAGTRQLPPYHLTFFDGRFAIYKRDP